MNDPSNIAAKPSLDFGTETPSEVELPPAVLLPKDAFSYMCTIDDTVTVVSFIVIGIFLPSNRLDERSTSFLANVDSSMRNLINVAVAVLTTT